MGLCLIEQTSSFRFFNHASEEHRRHKVLPVPTMKIIRKLINNNVHYFMFYAIYLSVIQELRFLIYLSN